jgi:hypothetical protein
MDQSFLLWLALESYNKNFMLSFNCDMCLALAEAKCYETEKIDVVSSKKHVRTAIFSVINHCKVFWLKILLVPL